MEEVDDRVRYLFRGAVRDLCILNGALTCPLSWIAHIHTISQAAFAETGVSRDLRVGSEVAILGVSMFVLGLGMLRLYLKSQWSVCSYIAKVSDPY